LASFNNFLDEKKLEPKKNFGFNFEPKVIFKKPSLALIKFGPWPEPCRPINKYINIKNIHDENKIELETMINIEV
jgi:hypothetical protein